MLIAFEGTGGEVSQLFPPIFVGVRADFRPYNSYIWQFCQGYRSDKPAFAQYVTGPRTDGLNMMDVFEDGKDVVDSKLKANHDRRIDIIGYSRGGFAAMALARYVGYVHSRRVNFLGLFDPVRMSNLYGQYNNNAISGNCDTVCVIMRNAKTGSRSSWGNTGGSLEAGVKSYSHAYFMTSHSGMGGWPGGGDVTLSQNGDEMSESVRAGAFMAAAAGAAGVFSGRLWPHPF